MGNMNLFSDAMASGKHSDKNDNYQEYEKSDYSQDNQYTQDYNYNYESMKQQQQQSSYDNNYGYDNNKKISYSDSYEDMKTYSTYSTKDKKYVCQTGQFKGFYVESVEFCKLKIAQGPAGPQGIPGIPGAIGPQGPAGPNELNSTSFYTVFGDFAPENSTALCNSGDIVISGGHRVDASVTDNVNIDFSEKLPTGQGWQTIIFDFGGNATVQTSVYCFNNP